MSNLLAILSKALTFSHSARDEIKEANAELVARTEQELARVQAVGASLRRSVRKFAERSEANGSQS